MRSLAFLLVFTGSTFTLTAQINKYVTDTDSIHHICEASLQVISVKKGEAVNWERFMNLYLPDGVMIWTGSKNDTCLAKTIPVQKMKGYNGWTENGFNEKALKRKINHFGQVATVFESYEATTPDGKYKSRGVNIYQLIYKQGRWWIASISWCDETERLKLPAEMTGE